MSTYFDKATGKSENLKLHKYLCKLTRVCRCCFPDVPAKAVAMAEAFLY